MGEIVNTPEAMVKLVKQLSKGGTTLSFCYEAGSCGYGIHRQLQELEALVRALPVVGSQRQAEGASVHGDRA